MKRLHEIAPLKGQLETISAVDFRKNPGEVFDSVQFGKTFVITRQGKPCALLTQLPGQILNIEVDRDGKKSFGLEI